MDPKQNQGSGPEVQALKNQLQEKDRMLHSLEVIEGLEELDGLERKRVDQAEEAWEIQRK